MGNYNETFNWVNKVKELGDYDYETYTNRYLLNFNNSISLNKDILLTQMKDKFINLKDKSSAYYGDNMYYSAYGDYNKELVSSYFSKLSGSEIQEFFRANPELKKFTYKYLYIIIDNGDFKKALELYNYLLQFDTSFEKLIDNEYKNIVNTIVEYYRIQNNIAESIKLILKIKNEFNNRPLALNLINLAIERFSNELDKIEYLNYLKIRILTIERPRLVEQEVEAYCKLFPYGKYTDDVLAELIQVNLFTFREPKKASLLLDRLIKKYPRGNACDNALNWMAKYYYQPFNPNYYYYTEEEKYNDGLKCIEINDILIRNYPESSYYTSAKSRNIICKDQLNIEKFNSGK